MRTIRDALPEGYSLPYGCRFDLTSFARVRDDRLPGSEIWEITTSVQGERAQDERLVTYRVSQHPLMANSYWLTSDEYPQGSNEAGATSAMQHPYEKWFPQLSFPPNLNDPTAVLADWVDAIGMRDAEQAQRSQGLRWEGDDLRATFARMEFGIVAFRSSEVATQAFNDPQGLQTWLTGALQGTQATVRVHAIDRFFSKDLARPRHLLQAWGTELNHGWAPISVDDGSDPMGWFGDVETLTPSVLVRYSGRELVHFEARYVVPWNELHAAGSFVGSTDFSEWWVIEFIETNIAMVFPSQWTNICVGIDDDGASVTIQASSNRERELFHRRRSAFEKRWGRWLDESVVLSPREIEKGVAAAEGPVRAALGIQR